MSQVITNAFETYWQGCLTDQVPVVLDEVVLADIPNLDITAPIDPNTGLPPQAQIVHRHPVDQRGRINNNAVAYSIVMDTTVGNFSFNAMYLINKASGMVGMIVYKGRETKTKTDQATGTTGNSLVKSMLMEYDQAATATVTTVEAGTWQIDYSARLLGMDEQLRLQAIACFGSSAFFGDGFKLINKAGSYKVQPGVAMVGGLRIQLDVEQAVTVGAKPVGVWVDVHHAGTILSRWDNHFEFKTSTTELTDYTDSNGYRHYVAKLGVVEADAAVTDKRQVNESQDLWGALRAHAESRNHPDASDSAKGFTQYAKVQEALEGEADNLSLTPKVMKAVMKALGLTKYGAPMIGVPIDWPLAQMPQDIWPDCGMVFLSCAGQSFNKATYPIAAQLYPSGVMSEIRGEFVRAWDNGRGVDPGRTLLSSQLDALQNITGTISFRGGVSTGFGVLQGGSGPFSASFGTGQSANTVTGGAATPANTDIVSFNLSSSARTSNETRSRNIAFHKIMRVG